MTLYRNLSTQTIHLALRRAQPGAAIHQPASPAAYPCNRGGHGLALLVFFLWLGLAGLFWAGKSHAAEAQTAVSAQVSLDQSRALLESIQTRLQQEANLDDTALVGLRNSLNGTQEQMQELVVSLEPELNSVQARLHELGSTEAGAAESDALSAQRVQLQTVQSTLDGQVKQARLIAVESRQGLEQISKLRRALFQAELGTRSVSVLSPRFWRNIARDFPEDRHRAAQLGLELWEHWRQAPARSWLPALLGGVLLAGLAIFLARRLTLFTVAHTAPSRLRRSFYAATLIALYTLTPGLLLGLMLLLSQSHAALSPVLRHVMQQVVLAGYLAGFVAGIGRVLLAPHRPSWRLPPIPSVIADRLGWLPYVLAIVLALGWVCQQLLGLINASLSTALLVNSANTLCLIVLIGFTAWVVTCQVKQLQIEQVQSGQDQPSGWLMVIPGALLLSMGISFLSLLLGYIALGTVIVQEVLWLALVTSSSYVLLALIKDISDSLLQSLRDRAQQHQWPPTRVRARSQLNLLLSGAARICILVMAVTLVLLPFGEHPGDWLQRRLGFLLDGFHIGQVQIKPASVMLSVVILLLGIYIVRLLQRWLAERFLPVTSLDPGMRGSTANLFSYVGYFFVFAMVLSAMGIGLDRMAWIISALSVGIGFGLQAVVQNFVSGLILLAERPIKVGDWVSVNGVEGNVRKINARATEIEMFDRSTLIVPNSEFITKTVRNVTLTDPLGQVKVQITLPIDTDASLVRELMFEAMREHELVLREPAPGVSLDGFNASSGLVFTASCYVSGPRVVSGVRSALMFDILHRLREKGVGLHPTQVMSLARPEGAPGSVACAEFPGGGA